TLLVDAGNNAAQGCLAGRIDDSELVAKVTEEGAEKTEGVCNDDIDALGVAVIGNGLLGRDGRVCQDNNLVLVKLREVLVQPVQSLARTRRLKRAKFVFAYPADW